MNNAAGDSAALPRVSLSFSSLRSFHSLRSLFPLCSLCSLLISTASGQDLGIKAPAQSEPIAIVNARISPVAGAEIERGHVVFDKGVIVAIGSGDYAGPLRARTVDVKGQHVYPGFIGAVTATGIAEIPTVRPYRDSDEVGDASPEAAPFWALNVDSTIPPVTRANGVLSVGVFPSGGSVPGQISVVRLDGWTWEEMTIRQSAGVVVNWPFMRAVNAWWMDRSEEDQMRDSRRSLDRIDGIFTACAQYVATRAADPKSPEDIRWEAMKAVLPPHEATPTAGAPLEGAALEAARAAQLQVFISASDVDQINAAVAWAAERKLKPVIVGGLDAPLCAELLKQHNVPVILTGVHELPRRSDMDYDQRFTLPAKLESLGITWCLASGEDTQQERNLPYNAATAVAYGLPREAAVRAITSSPAKILGVDKTLGTLEVGKSATLFVSTGDPLEVRSNVVHAFIDGREIDLRNKQTQLRDKYRERYMQMGVIRR